MQRKVLLTSVNTGSTILLKKSKFISGLSTQKPIFHLKGTGERLDQGDKEGLGNGKRIRNYLVKKNHRIGNLSGLEPQQPYHKGH